MTLCLPRDPSSVAVARHITRHLLEAVGTARWVVDDVEVGVGEACANAVQHAWQAQTYVVAVTIEDAVCAVWVVDEGPGFELQRVPLTRPDAEGGRGLPLMRAVMDTVEVVSRPSQGTVVRLSKGLDGP